MPRLVDILSALMPHDSPKGAIFHITVNQVRLDLPEGLDWLWETDRDYRKGEPVRLELFSDGRVRVLETGPKAEIACSDEEPL